MSAYDIPGWDRQTLPKKGSPQGWIQFKGSDLCIDLTCICGNKGHVDGADFLYYAKCGKCGKTYMLNGHIELIELTPEELNTTNSGLAKDPTEF